MTDTHDSNDASESTASEIAIKLNGRWAMLLKTCLLLVPIFSVTLTLTVPLMVWIVVGVFESKAFIARGDRFTREDGLELYMRMNSEHDIDIRKMEATIAALPPTMWQDRISIMEKNQAEVLMRLDRIEQKIP